MDTFKTYIQNLLSEQKQTFDEQNLRQGSMVMKDPCCTMPCVVQGLCGPLPGGGGQDAGGALHRPAAHCHTHRLLHR